LFFFFKNLPVRLRALKTALTLYSEEKDQAFAAKATEDQIKLFQIQEELEKEFKNERFMDLSLSETIYKCILFNQIPKATKLKSDFKVSENKSTFFSFLFFFLFFLILRLKKITFFLKKNKGFIGLKLKHFLKVKIG